MWYWLFSTTIRTTVSLSYIPDKPSSPQTAGLMCPLPFPVPGPKPKFVSVPMVSVPGIFFPGPVMVLTKGWAKACSERQTADKQTEITLGIATRFAAVAMNLKRLIFPPYLSLNLHVEILTTIVRASGGFEPKNAVAANGQICRIRRPALRRTPRQVDLLFGRRRSIHEVEHDLRRAISAHMQ